jgi:hypothetical protein
MTDTAIPTSLASREELDARLKRADENRWLASRYAPPQGRRLLVAVYLLHQELARALQAKEAMLGKIRIQWWRETLEQIAARLAGTGEVRRHDLSLELAEALAGRADLIAPLNDLVDRFDDIIDDHMRSGHQATPEHEALHLEAEASLSRLAGLVLEPKLDDLQLNALGRCGEAHVATIAQLPDVNDRWLMARVAAQSLPTNVWPAIAHLVADAPHGRQRSPFARRYRVFKAMLLHRLGKRMEME